VPEEEGHSFTIKEVVLQTQKELRELSQSLQIYINQHDQRHVNELIADTRSRDELAIEVYGDIQKELAGWIALSKENRVIIDRHDDLIQRLIGAVALASFLGLGGLVLVVLRIMGVIQ
jgi:hypothetical protein